MIINQHDGSHMTFFGSRGGSEGAGVGLKGTQGGDAADVIRAEARHKRGMNGAMLDALLSHHRTIWRDATKISRRLYVGNIDATSADVLAAELEDRIRTKSPRSCPWHYPLDKKGALDTRRAPGTRVGEHVYLNDKGYGFVETTCLEDVPVILALNGIRVGGSNVLFRRTKDYDPETNPLVRSGTYETVFEKGFRSVVADEVADSPTKVYIGNIEPSTLTELELLEIVSSFGVLRAMRCELDDKGRCRGDAWIEYEDGEVVGANAVAGLDGYLLKGRLLVAAFATPDALPRVGNDEERTTSERTCTYEVPPRVTPLLAPPPRVLSLSGVLTRGMTADERVAAAEDTYAACVELGNVLSTHVVSDEAFGADDELAPVRDCVFIEFARVETSNVAAHLFHGRVFDGRVTSISFFPLVEYQRLFGKGFPPRTTEEKQAAALKVMDMLAGVAGTGAGRLAA